MKKKANLKSILFYVALLVLLFVLIYALYGRAPKENITYSDVLTYFETEQVSEFVYDNGTLTMKLRDGTEPSVRLASFDLFYMDLGETILDQYRDGVIEVYDVRPPAEIPWYVSLIPYVLLIGAFAILCVFMLRQSGAAGGGRMMSFGRARIKTGQDQKKVVRFSDVAGSQEEKEELVEVVDFLKAPQKYTELGARIPKGILLVGPPGTGKTLLAKAVAGEAGVPFLSISGSDFVEMFVGVGASRVRDLFDQAKKDSPSIVFIDEIDAVGRHRGAGLGGGHDEREQTLNQLLVEMDGFGVNEGVIVMAATNRQDILDPALMRPGRFDRQIYVGRPDIRAREEILVVHARNKPMSGSVNLNTIAKTTAGFTGADLENLLNEAALLAARRSKKQITMDEVEEAMLKVSMGPEKRSKVVTDKAKKLTAYHEAGHAIVMRSLPTQDPVHYITVIPRGPAGGFTMPLPTEDKMYTSRTDMCEELAALLGGRVAEALVLGDISTGASNDIERATGIARAMVTRYGMSDRLGTIVYGSEQDEIFLGRDFAQTRNYSEHVASAIDEEIKRLIDTAYQTAEAILTERMELLHRLAGKLFTDEVVEEEEFEEMYTASNALPASQTEEAPAEAEEAPAEETPAEDASAPQNGETDE